MYRVCRPRVVIYLRSAHARPFAKPKTIPTNKEIDRPPVCKRDRRDDDAASGFLCRRASVRRRRCHLYQNWWVHKHYKLSFASCAIRYRDLCVIVRGAFLRRLEIFLATSPNFI